MLYNNVRTDVLTQDEWYEWEGIRKEVVLRGYDEREAVIIADYVLQMKVEDHRKMLMDYDHNINEDF